MLYLYILGKLRTKFVLDIDSEDNVKDCYIQGIDVDIINSIVDIMVLDKTELLYEILVEAINKFELLNSFNEN